MSLIDALKGSIAKYNKYIQIYEIADFIYIYIYMFICLHCFFEDVIERPIEIFESQM